MINIVEMKAIAAHPAQILQNINFKTPGFLYIRKTMIQRKYERKYEAVWVWIITNNKNHLSAFYPIISIIGKYAN